MAKKKARKPASERPVAERSEARDQRADEPVQGDETSSGGIKGLLALYEDPDTILAAAKKAKQAGFTRWDVFTPFPVHGMDEAMGMGRSFVPWVTLGAGLVGMGTALFIQFGTMVYSWPNNFGGKPAGGWPSFVPITFEMTVLFAGITTAFVALVVGGVFKWKKPKLDPDLTCHRFGIYVDASDPKYDGKKSRALLESTGAVEVRLVKEGA
jgi:hypothetical protein